MHGRFSILSACLGAARVATCRCPVGGAAKRTRLANNYFYYLQLKLICSPSFRVCGGARVATGVQIFAQTISTFVHKMAATIERCQSCGCCCCRWLCATCTLSATSAPISQLPFPTPRTHTSFQGHFWLLGSYPTSPLTLSRTLHINQRRLLGLPLCFPFPHFPLRLLALFDCLRCFLTPTLNHPHPPRLLRQSRGTIKMESKQQQI